MYYNWSAGHRKLKKNIVTSDNQKVEIHWKK